MKKILILYPHFPPSNLAGVHRPRLFAQHLPEFGWEPVILTVDEKYYEEAPDLNLVKLSPDNLRIEKVNHSGKMVQAAQASRPDGTMVVELLSAMVQAAKGKRPDPMNDDS